MKSILISINPKWCEKIASGEKTIEVRKTRPKLEMPFKVYIYCTASNIHECLMENENGAKLIYASNYKTAIPVGGDIANGKVIGEFVCDRIEEFTPSESGVQFKRFKALYDTCLSVKEIRAYLNGKVGYGWHISDLVIYDKPRELSEFYISDNAAIQSCKHREIVGQPEYKTAHNGWIKGSYICNANGEPDWCTKCKVKPITRPPQSWCYVEEVHNG